MSTSRDRQDPFDAINQHAGKIIFGIGAVAAFGWAATRLKTAQAGRLLVKSGLGISTRKIGTTFVQLPYQHIAEIDYQPFNVGPFVVDSITEEKTKVDIPVMVTVRPFRPGEHKYKEHDDGELKDAFENFVMSSIHMSEKDLKALVQPMLQGDIRRLTPEHSIFNLIGIRSKVTAAAGSDKVADVSGTKAVLEGLDSKDFSTAAIATAQLAMIPHGLKVVNLTIQDLQNHPKSPIPIIDEITTKGTQEIAAEARIGAAKAQQKAIEAENRQKEAVAESKQKLDCAQANFLKLTEMAKLEADMNVKQKEVDLQRELETKKRQQQEEALRASDLAKATVNAEALLTRTQGDATAVAKKAEGEALAAVKHAEGQAIVTAKKAEGEATATAKRAEGEAAAAAKKADGEALSAARRAEGEAKAMLTLVQAEASAAETRAQAESNAKRLHADAQLFSEVKRAEGISQIWAANNKGLAQAFEALGKDSQMLQFYLASQRDDQGRTVIEGLAAQSAAAIKGLNPQMSIVTMAGEGGADKAMDPVRNLYKVVPPVVEMLRSQGLDIKGILEQHFPVAAAGKKVVNSD